MKNKKVEITLIGGGKYALNLIFNEYQLNKKCSIKSVISPHLSEALKNKHRLSGLPILPNIIEWKKKFGLPTNYDIFDLCVHCHLLPQIIEEFANNGVKNFILPKPIATRKKEFKKILKLQKKFNLNCVVASQWYYSSLISKAKKIINGNVKKKNISKIIIEFSQFFSAEQLKNYSVITALLPHMLQIIHSMDIDISHMNGKINSLKVSNNHIEVEYFAKNFTHVPIKLITDIKSHNTKRNFIAYDINNKPIISIDFTTEFKNGKILKYPSIKYNGQKIVIKERDLGIMVKKEIEFFSNKKNKNLIDVLTLEKYFPIEKNLIEINNQHQKLIRKRFSAI